MRENLVETIQSHAHQGTPMDLDSMLQRLGPTISQGATTTVYSIADAEDIMLKEVLIDGLSDDALRSLESLQDVLPRLCHPSILSCKKVAKRDSNFYLLMARYPSSLDSLIRTYKRQKQVIPTTMVIKVAYQVAAGLAYLHDPNKKDADGKSLPSIVHGRVKPTNILVNVDETQFVLSDAGICIRDVYGGVIAYTAPEVRAGAAPTPASDMWSLGTVLYEMATGSRPAEDEQIRLEAVEDAMVREVISQLLVLEPEGRISALGLIDMLSSNSGPATITNALKIKILEAKQHSFESMQKNIRNLEAKLERIHQLESDLVFMREIVQRLAPDLPLIINNSLQPVPDSAPVTCDEPTSLMKAASNGDIETVRKFIATKDGLKHRDEDGKTALMYAVQKGNTEIVWLLAPYEAGMQNSQGLTALMYASETGHFDIAKAIAWCEKGMKTKYGRTALMIAAQNGHADVVKFLVDYEKGMKDVDDQTALMIAAQKGHIDIMKLLADHEKGIKTKYGRTTLMIVAFNGHTDIAKLLVNHEKGVQSNTGWTALMTAAFRNNIGIVKLLADHEKGMKNNDDQTALMIAAEKGHIDVVRILADYEKGMTARSGKTALMIAAEKGHIDVVKFLLKYENGMRDIGGSTALNYSLYSSIPLIFDTIFQYPEERVSLSPRSSLLE